MAFSHRKLLDETIPQIISTLCSESCPQPQEYNNTCPISCFSVCPLNSCKPIIIPLPPPPPPPPLMAPLSPAADAPKHHNPTSVPLMASLAVLATAFFLFTCYTIYKFYTVWRNSPRRRRREEDGSAGPDDDFLDEEVVDHPIWYIRTIGLQPSVINAISIVNYKSADGLVEGTDCAVCLTEFQEDETLRLLPKCSHAFHIPCIDTWLTSHTTCPMCRAGIVANAASPVLLHETPDRHSARAEEARPEFLGSEADIELEGDALSQIRVEMNESGEGGECKIDADGLQPVRRSVSMDSLSASMISAAVASAFPRLAKGKVEDVGNRSSSSIKRSASCSAKVFLSRHSSRR